MISKHQSHRVIIGTREFDSAVAKLARAYADEGDAIPVNVIEQALAMAMWTMLHEVAEDIEHHAFGPDRTLKLDGWIGHFRKAT